MHIELYRYILYCIHDRWFPEMKGSLEDNYRYNMFGLVSWCCFFAKASAMRAPKIRRQQQRKPKMRREILLI